MDGSSIPEMFCCIFAGATILLLPGHHWEREGLWVWVPLTEHCLLSVLITLWPVSLGTHASHCKARMRAVPEPYNVGPTVLRILQVEPVFLENRLHKWDFFYVDRNVMRGMRKWQRGLSAPTVLCQCSSSSRTHTVQQSTWCSPFH